MIMVGRLKQVPPPEAEALVADGAEGVSEEDRKRYRKERTKGILSKFKTNKVD